MIKIVRHASIYGMSMNRNKAIQRIDGFNEEIASNILKLSVYTSNTQDYQHWIDELATWFSDINDITIKPSDRKLNESMYDDLVFGQFGTTISDVRSYIDLWLIRNRKTQQYPNFTNSSKITKDVFLKVSELRAIFLRLFASKNNKTRSDILKLLNTIFYARK